jgi:hypothetical protein
MRWKDIQGYEGLYQISSDGRVKSISPHTIQQFGKFIIRKVHTEKSGYVLISLKKNNQSRRFRIHQLVANAFIPNPLKLPQVNHKDGNKQNNYVNNLEWSTARNNLQHAIDTGLRKFYKGEDHHCAKLTQKDADKIRKLYNSGMRVIDISRIYKMSAAPISMIVHNKRFLKNVS